jgi:hypothetical protein
LELVMPPRPHLAFRGRFDVRGSLSLAGLGKALDAAGGPGPGPSRPPGRGGAAFGPTPPRDRVLLSAIVAGEVFVLLTIVVLVVRGTTAPRQSSWMLLVVFLVMLGLSFLRRKTFPGSPAD